MCTRNHLWAALLTSLPLVAVITASCGPAATTNPTPAPMGITLGVAPNTPSLGVSDSTASLLVAVAPIGDFAGKVSLDLRRADGRTPFSGLELSAASVEVRRLTTAMFPVTLKETSSLTPGVIYLVLHAQGDGVSASTPLTVQVVAPVASNPDFAFSAPTELAGVAGGTVQVIYTLTPLDGFQGPVTITAGTADGRVPATETQVDLTTGGSEAVLATLEIGAGVPTSEPLVFTAAAAGKTHAVTASLTISAAPAPGVDLSLSPAETAAVPNGTAQVLVTLTSVGGYDGLVHVQATTVGGDAAGADLPSLAIHPGTPVLQPVDVVVASGSWAAKPDPWAEVYVRPVLDNGSTGTPGPERTLLVHQLPGFSHHEFNVGGGVHAAALGDLDGDGKPDLLVWRSTASGNTVEVHRGRGFGYFDGTSQTLPLPSAAAAMALADVDGDGQLDLVVAGATLSVFQGTGAGAFQTTPTTTALASPATHLAVADLDGDGNVDAVVTGFPSSTVEIGYGAAGSRAFSIHRFSSAASANPDAVAALGSTGSGGTIAFVDDHQGEIAALSVHGDRTVTPQSPIVGNGSYGPSTRLFTIPLPGAAGRLLVVSDGATVDLENWQPASLRFGGSPVLVAGGDLDVDGHLDLVTANQDGSIQIRMGSIHRGWLPPAPTAGSGEPVALFVSALDGPEPVGVTYPDILVVRADGTVTYVGP